MRRQQRCDNKVDPERRSLGGSQTTPVEHDFAGIAGFHQLDRFLELRVREAVGDNRRNVETGLDHGSHFVPGFVHLPAVNAFDG
jgi:hypothetical protein